MCTFIEMPHVELIYMQGLKLSFCVQVYIEHVWGSDAYSCKYMGVHVPMETLAVDSRQDL